jgi:LmbE family N-acetylglucosaminyl deacetylase
MKHLADSPRRIVVRMVLVVLLIGWVLSIVAHEPVAQTPAAVDKAELHQALLDLTNSATVMCVAAHPDDEDGTTLTVLRRKYGVHTVTLFSTYGEGGQNAVGPELYEELGVIRARETMEAARIQGSEPHFLGLKDFGFSKSAEEAFQVWGHDEALRRMVHKIRELRPDVIITNHDTTTGHGHHQATGRLVLEAFDAAADAKRFPEQLANVSVWQVKRLFVRARAAAASTTTPPTNASDKLVAVDPNEVDPIRGTMYAEQALAALQKHASQGPWPASIAERLRGNLTGKLPLIRYRLAREAAGAPALATETKTFFDGLQVAVRAAPTIDGRTLADIVDQPDRVLNALIDWRRRTGPGLTVDDDRYRSRLMTDRVDHALALAAGIILKVSSQAPALVPGTPARFTINLSNTGNRTVQIKKLSMESWGNVVPLDPAEILSADTETITPLDLVTPTTAAITVPLAEHLYDDLLFGHRFVAQTQLEIDGAKFSVKAENSLGVVPAVEITKVSPSPCVRTEATLSRCEEFQITLKNHLAKPFVGSLSLATTTAQLQHQTSYQIQLTPLETRVQTFTNLAPPPPRETLGLRRQPGKVLISINTDPEQKAFDRTRSISNQTVTITYADARVAKDLRVGYLPSFDQTLEQALNALGVIADKLTDAEIREGSLTRYNTIIIDNRGYYAHPELIAANSKLMKYVEEGGTLIVFYHKDSEWNPNSNRGRPQLAPYPITLGDERVTEEVAAIRFLQPRHPLLNRPNKIRSSDFTNWIQERGLYYPSEWDSHYTALFESNDTGEKPLRGGLLVARYGRGDYIYTSMVWYRQLAAGVPGAYRMLANMISYGK